MPMTKVELVGLRFEITLLVNCHLVGILMGSIMEMSIDTCYGVIPSACHEDGCLARGIFPID